MTFLPRSLGVMRLLAVVHVFVLLGSLCTVNGDENSSYCPKSCFSGSCCEVESNDFRCCAYENGVCCSDGKHCCPQGSTCDAKHGTCSYGFGESPFPMMETKKQVVEPVLTKPVQDRFVICPDRESTCADSMTCCKMKNDTYGCCSFDKGVCCSDGLHCCPEGSVCDLKHSTCSSQTKSPQLPKSILPMISAPKLAASRPTDRSSPDLVRAMNYESIMCPNSSFECPSRSTCCLMKSEDWGCCPMPEAVCCSDGAHCCPKRYTCDLQTQECILDSEPNDQKQQQQQQQELSRLLAPRKPQSIQCPNTEWECPTNTTCCQMLDQSWGCCDSPNAVCCSDGLHCCPANSVCDLEKSSCILPSGDGVPAIAHSLSQLPANDQVCPGAESVCRNGTCCKTPTGVHACCPHVDAVCCHDMEHCCPKGYQCHAESGSCLPLSATDAKPFVVDKPKQTDLNRRPWFKKLPALKQAAISNLSQVCPGGDYTCETGTTCCQMAEDQWGCCPLPNAVCCPDHEHCCPEGTECDVAHETCSPRAAATSQTPMKPSRIPDETSHASTNVCPDHKSVCEGEQTCCTLPDQTWACCPLEEGICCSDHLHCCPRNTVCLPDSSGCVSQLPDPFQPPSVVPATQMTRSPSSQSMLVPADQDQPNDDDDDNNKIASWCGACGEQGCCTYSNQNEPVMMCCPHTEGICCPDAQFCCPRHARCLPNGQCELSPNTNPSSFAPFLIPPKSDKSKMWAVPTVAVAPPADWDVLLDFVQYRHLRQVRNTVCPDNLHFCEANQKCCPSRKYGYTCIPDTASCCSETLNTYCPPPKSCSMDGLSCL